MRELIPGVLIFLLVFCTGKSEKQFSEKDTTLTQTAKEMNNMVSIIEIPVSDLKRAKTFYQEILNLELAEAEMDGVQMGVFPANEEGVNVVLAKGKDYKPTADGAVIYLNAGNDLTNILAKIEPNGGEVIVEKTEISPEMGFFAMFIDSEGNKLGLHSLN